MRSRRFGPAWRAGGAPAVVTVGTTLSAFNISDTHFRFAKEMIDAYQLFVKWLNTVRGGVRIGAQTYQLELVVADDRSTQAGVAAATHMLLDQLNVDILLGPYGSELSMAMAEIVASRPGTLALMPAASAPAVFEAGGGAGHGRLFGLLPPAPGWWQPLFETLNGTTRTVAFVMQPGMFSEALCEKVPQYAADNGMSLVYNYTFSSSEPDASERAVMADEIRRVHPDLFLICSDETLCLAVLTSLEEGFVNPGGIALPHLCIHDLQSKKVGLGHFFLGATPWLEPYESDDQEATWAGEWSSESFDAQVWTAATFQQEYEAYFAPEIGSFRPTYQAATAFAACEVLVQAMEAEGGRITAQGVAERLARGSNYMSILGDIRFDNVSGQNVDGRVGLTQLQGNLSELLPVLLSPALDPAATGSSPPIIFPIPQWVERPCHSPQPLYGTIGFGALKTAYWNWSALTAGEVTLAANQAALQLGEAALLPSITAAVQAAAPPSTLDPRGAMELLRSVGAEVFASLGDDTSRALDLAEDYFRTSTGKQICTHCPENQVSSYDPVTQRRSCTSCPIELLPIELPNGDRRCQPDCPIGQASQGEEDGGTCADCPPGTLSFAAATKRECGECPPGYITSLPAQTACEACPIGYYSASDGSSHCSPCPAGSETHVRGSSTCMPCMLGTYSTEEGSAECTFCAFGTVASDEGSTECTGCSPGRFAVWGAVECRDCPPGTFQPNANQSSCMRSLGGSLLIGSGLEKGENLPGYWARFEPPLIIWDYCYQVPVGCLEGERCGKGSTGMQCSACLPGYSYHTYQASSACLQCPAYWWSLTATGLIFVVTVAGAILVTIVTHDTIRHSNDAHVIVYKILIHYGVVMGMLGSVIKEALFESREVLSEVAVSISRTLAWMSTMLHLGAFMDTGLWSLQCVFLGGDVARYGELTRQLESMRHSDWFQPQYRLWVDELRELQELVERRTVQFWALFPVAVCIATASTTTVVLFVYGCKRRSFYGKANRFYKELVRKGPEQLLQEYSHYEIMRFVQEFNYRLLGIWWPFHYLCSIYKQGFFNHRLPRFLDEMRPLLLCSLWLILSQVLMGLTWPINCGQMGSGRATWMRRASTIRCDTGSWLRIFSIVFFCIWGFALPLVLQCVMSLKRKRTSFQVFERQYGILIVGYQLDRQWWECVIFLSKSLAIFSGSANVRPSYKILLQLLTSILYGGASQVLEPFDRRCNGILKRVEGAFVAVWIFSALLAEIAFLSNSSEAWLSASLINAVFHTGFLLYTMLAMGRYGALDQANRGFLSRFTGRWLSRITEKMQQKEPYVCLEHMLGWVSACGDGGHEAFLPYIADSRRGQYRLGRPQLSKAPAVPRNNPGHPDVHTATAHQRRLLHRSLSDALERVSLGPWQGAGGKCPILSVSLLEFVMRCGMMLGMNETFDTYEDLLEYKERVSRRATERELQKQATSSRPSRPDSRRPSVVTRDSDGHGSMMSSRWTWAETVSDELPEDTVDVNMLMEDSVERRYRAQQVAMNNHKRRRLQQRQFSTILTATGKVKDWKRTKFDIYGNREEMGLQVEVALEMLHGNLAQIFGLTKRRSGFSRALSHGVRSSIDSISSQLGATQVRCINLVDFCEGLTRCGRWWMRCVVGLCGLRMEVQASRRWGPSIVDESAEENAAKYYCLPETRMKQLDKWVRRMFGHELYSRGTRIQALHLGLTCIQALSPREVRYLLDRFEERWTRELRTRSFLLHRFANDTQDAQCQVDLLDGEADPEEDLSGWWIAAPRPRDANAQGRAAMHWLRLVLSMCNWLTPPHLGAMVATVVREKAAQRHQHLLREMEREQAMLADVEGRLEDLRLEASKLRRCVISKPNTLLL